MRKIFLALIVLINISNNLYSQDDKTPKELLEPNEIFISFSPSIGGFDLLDEAGTTLGGDINIRKKETLFSTEFKYGTVIFGSDFNMLNFHLGKRKGADIFKYHYQIGIGTIWEKENSNKALSLDDYEFRANLALRSGFRYLPIKYFGIGLDFQVNFNSINSNYMVPLISIEIGNVR